MISPVDAFQLARTKLKTRRIRLFITVLISALLFSVLVFLAAITEGTIRSVQEFNKEGYGNRFIVAAVPLSYQQYSGDQEKTLIDQLKATNDQLISKKKALAKKLGLEYDSVSDQNLPLQKSPDPGSKDYYPNYTNPIISEILIKKDKGIKGASYGDFQALSKKAGAIKTFKGVNPDFGSLGQSSKGELKILVDGKEEFRDTDQKQQDQGSPPTGTNSINTLGWSTMDDQLLQPFVLPGQVVTHSAKSIPIIAPFSAAEQILGLKSLPPTAKSEEKIQRLDEVRKKIAGYEVTMCLRNGASTSLTEQAIQQQKEISSNKGKKDYISPPLLYASPTKACGQVVIKSDKRTTQEKKLANNQIEFDKAFGIYQSPTQDLLSLRIVGLSPDINFGQSFDVASILSSILSSSTGNNWVSPISAINKSPVAKKAIGIDTDNVYNDRFTYYAEFSNLQDMKEFAKSQECSYGINSGSQFGGGTYFESSDQLSKCINQGKVFSVFPYGNSAGAIDGFRTIVWNIGKIALIIVVVLASLVVMGNIGKIIADSRKETAVFRAIGAKRLDIAQIYVSYTILIAFIIMIAAVIVGSCAAFYVHSKFSPALSAAAVNAYNASDIHKKFSLYGFNIQYLGIIGLCIILTSIIGATLPIILNTRRNPINDMRDDR